MSTETTPGKNGCDRIASSLDHQDKRPACDDEALLELYTNGHKVMQEAFRTERGDKKEDLLMTSKRYLEKANNLVDSLSLFSDNETIDDISTSNLKYLLIPAHLAKICISGEIRSHRLEAFTRAETYIRQFFQRISCYKILEQKVEDVLKTFNDKADSVGAKSLADQARFREEKIEKFNQTKDLERRLAELERRLNFESDDEIVREYYLELIRKCVHDTIDDLEGIVKPALVFERGRPALNDQHSSKPKAPEVQVRKTFVITKDMLKKNVFGTGYPSLPTVSVDEFITKKFNDGDLVFQKDKEVYSNSLQRYAEQPDLLREQEEQSEEEREEKEEKDDHEELTRRRRWDEFKDENPRGSGNRQNMG